MARGRERLWGAFRQIFDDALVAAHEQLLSAPSDLAAKGRFVTLYHLVLEATLGLTTFKLATEFLEREDLVPGFVQGYSKIHHDGTRHIGYGGWFLRETVAAHPRNRHHDQPATAHAAVIGDRSHGRQ